MTYKRGEVCVRLAIALALFIPVSFAPAPRAFATGLDCARATSATERTLCASDDLRQQDNQLAFAYRKLSVVLPPQQRAALRAAQTDWLKMRDQCGADAGCIQTRHEARIAALQTQLVQIIAYRPDNEDLAALTELRALVDAERRNNPAFPLETVIERLRIKNGVTRFDNEYNTSEDFPDFPRVRPKGVTADEWKALQASGIIDGGDENGSASYTLIDLDGDGRRDLVIQTYSGVWYGISVLHRKGARFEGNYMMDSNDGSIRDKDDGMGQDYIYSVDQRSANQTGDWIRLHGRVYAAYRNSHYGKDDVYLLRPFTVIGKVPKLTVRYRYRLVVPAVQRDGDGRRLAAPGSSELRAALTQALRSVSEKTMRKIGPDKPVCPIPASVEGDGRDAYTAMGLPPLRLKSLGTYRSGLKMNAISVA